MKVAFGTVIYKQAREYFDDLMALSGDKGARELFDKYKMNVYKYYISDKYLLDIDTKEDLEKVGA